MEADRSEVGDGPEELSSVPEARPEITVDQ